MGDDHPQPISVDLPPGVEERLKSGPFSQVEHFTVIAHWERPRSGTTFYRLRPTPTGRDVVMKLEAGENPAPAEPMGDAMNRLDDIIVNAGIPASHGLRVLAVLEDPPLIVTPYVDGEDVVSIMRRPDDPAWSAWMADWMTRAGAMLAAYHRSSTTPDSVSVAAAKRDVYDVARRLRIRSSTIDRLMGQVDPQLRLGRTYGDFGPGNLLGTVDGELYLLDPPVNPPHALIHRDLANFIFELRRQLAGRGFTPHEPVPDRFPGLLSEFLAGYSGTDHPLDDHDMGLIALFESRRALGMARKRFPGRLGDVSWFIRTALASRRRVIRASSAVS